MAEFDRVANLLTGRQAYFLDVAGTDSAAALSVVSFEATEKMGAPTEVRIVLTHPLQLAQADYWCARQWGLSLLRGAKRYECWRG